MNITPESIINSPKFEFRVIEPELLVKISDYVNDNPLRTVTVTSELTAKDLATYLYSFRRMRDWPYFLECNKYLGPSLSGEPLFDTKPTSLLDLLKNPEVIYKLFLKKIPPAGPTPGDYFSWLY